MYIGFSGYVTAATIIHECPDTTHTLVMPARLVRMMEMMILNPMTESTVPRVTLSRKAGLDTANKRE